VLQLEVKPSATGSATTTQSEYLVLPVFAYLVIEVVWAVVASVSASIQVPVGLHVFKLELPPSSTGVPVADSNFKFNFKLKLSKSINPTWSPSRTQTQTPSRGQTTSTRT
jgi:hypothetical protein